LLPRRVYAPQIESPAGRTAAIPAELPEQFSNGLMTAEAINAATLALKKALIKRAGRRDESHAAE